MVKKLKILFFIIVSLFILSLVTVNIIDYLEVKKLETNKKVIIPLKPLAGDHSYEKLNLIAAMVKAKNEATCDKANHSCLYCYTPFAETCREELAINREALKAFDDWLASEESFKLTKPKNLGRHSRLPHISSLTRDHTDFLRHIWLTKLLISRTASSMKNNDFDRAENDLKNIFLLANYLLQNPPDLIPPMIAISINGIAFQFIMDYWSNGALDQSILLKDKTLIDGIKIALGGEYSKTSHLSYPPNYWHEINHKPTFWEKNKYPLAKLFKVYSEKHTMALAKKFYAQLQNNLKSRKLGTSFAKDNLVGLTNWRESGLIRYIHNPFGRITFSVMDSFLKYPAKIAQEIDQIAALKIMLAARRYYQQHKSYPQKNSDLVPQYLAKWPISHLNGQPLNWSQDKSGITVLGIDGIKPCKLKQQGCFFPFKVKNYE